MLGARDQGHSQPEVSVGLCNCTLPTQEGFKNTRSRLQKVVKDAGHIFAPRPKSHCELS